MYSAGTLTISRFAVVNNHINVVGLLDGVGTLAQIVGLLNQLLTLLGSL